MAEIKITKCKSCGASITWIKTQNGRVMPCDVPAVDYQENYKGTDTVVTDDGRLHFNESKCGAPFPSMVVVMRGRNDD
jgi:hypothetical protein